MRRAVTGSLALALLLLSVGRVMAGERLVPLAQPGPWSGVSALIGYGDRLWLVNSVKFVDHNSADLYSYDPRTGALRYERHLFSQDAGDPVVADGRLYWPFEDARPVEKAPMVTHCAGRGMLALIVLLAGSALSGCGAGQAFTREGTAEPSVAGAASASGEPRWVLIQNLRYGATMAEPEFVWVKENEVPTSATTLIFGKKHVLAPLDTVRRAGPPPGGGVISPLQGGPPLASQGEPTPGSAPPATGAASPTEGGLIGPSPPQATARAAPQPERAPRGYVVHVQARLLVVDLTAVDGLQPGSRLSVRRAQVALKHPVTGDLLGELDEEIGTARVIEVRERFSVAELEEVRPGFEAQVKDRVRLAPP